VQLQQLVELGFQFRSRTSNCVSDTCTEKLFCELVDKSHDLPRIVGFIRQVHIFSRGFNANKQGLIEMCWVCTIISGQAFQMLRYILIDIARRMNNWHDRLMNLFILTAFDMARDQIITPKRLDYAQKAAHQLHNELAHIFSHSSDHSVQEIVDSALQQRRSAIVDDVARQTLLFACEAVAHESIFKRIYISVNRILCFESML